MKKQTDAPEKPKPTAEERLQLARARHAEEAERLEKRSAALTAKAVAREKDEKDLVQARTYARTATQKVADAEAQAKAERAALAVCNARVRTLETRLREKQAAAAPPPAEAAAGAEAATSSADAASVEDEES